MQRVANRQLRVGQTAMPRVIRKGNEFICGVCRLAHKEPAMANACLQRCWSEHAAQSVEPFSRNSAILWRCRSCHREFGARDLAENCAKECSHGKKLSFYTFHVDGSDLSELPEPKLPARRLMAIAPPPAQARKIQQKQSVQTPSASEKSNDAGSMAATPGPTVATSAANRPEKAEKKPVLQAAAAPKPPKDRTKKFFRDGARYVCNECSAKFFTKAEVEACWEQHP